MGRNRQQRNPSRRKSIPDQLADYRRSLRQRPVSATEESQPDFDMDSTDYTPPSTTPPPKEEAAPSPKLHTTYLWVKIIGGVLGIIIVVGTLAYNFASLSKGLESLKEKVFENKKELQERMNKSEEETRKDIRQVNDRIDNYFSRGQKR